MALAFAQVDIPTAARFVLVALANRADEDGYCWPGLKDLERRTGLTDRAIQKALKLLVDRKRLTITRRFHDNGQQTSNLYRLSLPSSLESNGESSWADTVNHVRGGTELHSPLRANHVRGEGEPRSPKSSSEQSSEQSIEHYPYSPPQRGVMSVVSTSATDFHEFWKAYPQKTGKKAALRAWQKARDRPPISEILAAISRAKNSRQWRNGYIPNPSTWLHQGRWSDEVMEHARHDGSSEETAPKTMAEWCALQGGAR